VCMANIRQKEFERSVIQLLLCIRDRALNEGERIGKGAYDVVLHKDDVRTMFTTYYCCSDACFDRYFKNLSDRGLLISEKDDCFRLNPEKAKTKAHFILTNQDISLA